MSLEHVSMKGESTRERHALRIQRVIDYIHHNFTSEIDNATVADVAHMSPYHWHRIYQAVTGESAIATLRRVRLERSAVALLRDDRPVAAIAADCGFENLHAYTRLFRQAYGLPPGQFRASGRRLKVSCGQENPAGEFRTEHHHETPLATSDRRPGKRSVETPDVQSDDVAFTQQWSQKARLASAALSKPSPSTDRLVDIDTHKPLRLVGRYHQGDYFDIGRVFQGIMAAAEIEAWPKAEPYTVGVYYDDPDVVPAGTCRAFAGIPVVEGFSAPEGYEDLSVEGGCYASFLHLGPYALLPESYRWLYREWLRVSSLDARDAPCHEIYLNTPFDTLPGKLETRICLPLAQCELP